MAKKELFDLYELETNKIDTDFSNYTVTVTGDGGVGKSTFLNAVYRRFGKTVTFGFEDRFKGIANMTCVPIKTWEELEKYKNQIRKGLKEKGKLPFKNMIIDPVGKAGDACEKYTCEENGIDSLGDKPYGAGYADFEKNFCTLIEEIRDLGVIVSFVSHGKNETITPPRQEGYNVQMPDIQKKLKYIVKDEVDFLLYMSIVRTTDNEGNPKAVRRLYFQNYPEFQLKVPLDGFPDYIEWEGDVEQGVDLFIEAFNHAVEITKRKNGEFNESTNDNKEKKIEETELFNDSIEEDIEKLREQAINIRDKMLETTEKIEVVKILKTQFGTAKLSEVEDISKLKNFIKEFEA